MVVSYSKLKIATSTSPSGRHLGHYKAILKAELPPTDKDLADEAVNTTKRRKIKNPLGMQIFEVLHYITMAAVRSGESLDRWKVVHSSMLEKDIGKPYINRLRVIHIYEADYNLVLKILWARQLTWHAHTKNALHEAQAGSRPGRKAIDVVVFKEMKYLHSRLTRTTLMTMDNDAKACYDRIVCNLAMLTSQYFGMPSNACLMQAKTLQHMRFHLRTAMGISDNYYTHTSKTPVHGSGQGSCASPTLWLIISSILMRCLDNTSSGMKIFPMIKGGHVSRSTIDGFVDDTSLFSNLPFYQDDFRLAINTLKVATQKWSELLQASGGKLELSKCFFYALNWNFSPEGDPIPMTIEDQKIYGQNIISIIDQDSGEHVNIQQKESDQVHKTLGVYKNILGDDSYQFQTILDKSTKLAQLISAAHMTRQQARLAYKMIYLPTITYCFPACSFSQQQLERIQKTSLPQFLSAMGWIRNTARALVHGPISLGGLNLHPLYALQGAHKLMTILNHVRAKSELGNIIITNINWQQVLVGKEEHFFVDCSPITYIDSNWLLHTQEYMEKCHLTLHSEAFWTPKLARINDQILMNAALLYTSKPKHLRIINNWRIYFQILRLSDMCDGNGQHILESYRDHKTVNNHNQYRTSKLNWPKQEQPHKSTFFIWKNFLTSRFGMQRKGMIRVKLGPWLNDFHDLDNTWNACYNSSETLLYIQKEFYYTKHPQAISRRFNSEFQLTPTSAVIRVPNTVIPATIGHQGDQFITASFQTVGLKQPPTERLRGAYVKHFLRNQPIRDQTFQDYLGTFSLWETDLCSFWHSEEKTEIIKAIENIQAPIIITTDGYSSFGTGRYAVVLTISDTLLFQNSGKIRNANQEIPIFRIKALGILSALVITRILLQYCKYQGTQERILLIYSNHIGVIKCLNKFLEEGLKIGAYNNSHMDVVLQIYTECQHLKTLNLQVRLYYQKRKSKNKQSNNREDTEKTQQWMEIASAITTDKTTEEDFFPHDTNYNYPSSVINIRWKNAAIQNQVHRIIIESYTSQAMTNYLLGKKKWTVEMLDLIWLPIHEKTLLRFQPPARQIIQKYNFNQWATNVREAKLHGFRSPQCETCGLCDDTTDHIIQCPCEERNKCRATLWSDLEKLLDTPDTPTGVKNCMYAGLRSWIENKDPPPFHQIEPQGSALLRTAYEEQTNLGWNQVSRGYLSIRWKYLIQIDILARKTSGRKKVKYKNRTPDSWGASLLQTLWNNILHMWDSRNAQVHNIYIKRGTTRVHEQLVLVAEQETMEDGDLEYKDRDWLDKTAEDFRKIPLNRLQLWVKNIQNMKQYIRKHRNTDIAE